MTAQPLLPPIFDSTDILETLFGPDLPDTRETPANGQAFADIVSGKWDSPIEPPELELGDDSEGTADGSHPSDLGFMRQAKVFYPVLQEALAAAGNR